MRERENDAIVRIICFIAITVTVCLHVDVMMMMTASTMRTEAIICTASFSGEWREKEKMKGK